MRSFVTSGFLGWCRTNFRHPWTSPSLVLTIIFIVRMSPLTSQSTVLSFRNMWSFSAICSKCSLSPVSVASRLTVVTMNLKKKMIKNHYLFFFFGNFPFLRKIGQFLHLIGNFNHPLSTLGAHYFHYYFDLQS